MPNVSTKAVFEDDHLDAPLPDVVLPSQFFESVGAKAFSAEQRLMLAVLTDAINILGEYRASPSQRKRKAFNETSFWVFSKGIDGPMSFDHVCDALGVNADPVGKLSLEFPRMRRRVAGDARRGSLVGVERFGRRPERV